MRVPNPALNASVFLSNPSIFPSSRAPSASILPGGTTLALRKGSRHRSWGLQQRLAPIGACSKRARQTFVLSGDIHHYERSQHGEALHVIAGGGGAFLHPARIAKGGLAPIVCWPGIAQSRFLLAWAMQPGEE